MTELKPCPFCGEEVEEGNSEYAGLAHCSNDDCMFYECWVPRDAWNRRPSDSDTRNRVNYRDEIPEALSAEFDITVDCARKILDYLKQGDKP